MAQISESLEALRKEAPARFLESDQFQEMRKTYEKLKPLADTKPKSFAKQCSGRRGELLRTPEDGGSQPPAFAWLLDLHNDGQWKHSVYLRRRELQNLH